VGFAPIRIESRPDLAGSRRRSTLAHATLKGRQYFAGLSAIIFQIPLLDRDPFGKPVSAFSNPAQVAWNTSVRNSMLSRGGAPAGVVGSTKALCGAKRARPSVLESKHFSSKTSSAVIFGT
jgi:hypothetical protein